MTLAAQDFAGVWQVDRRIEDRLEQMSGDFSGTATLTQTSTGLLYCEAGQLRLQSGAVLQAERQYHWAFDDTGVAVTFADGAPFHHFFPFGQSDGTPHQCAADLYVCAYDFRNWPRWQAEWVVTGPRKDYTSATLYTRG